MRSHPLSTCRLPAPLTLAARVGLGLAALAPLGAAQISLGGYLFDAAAGPDVAIPMPGSQPEFGGLASPGCGTSVTYPGQSLAQSVDTVMLSNDDANWVFGRAVIRLDFVDNSIVNLPGPDLVVFEVGGAENFRLSVFFDGISEWSAAKLYTPTATGFSVPCGVATALNARAIDLEDFGILPGARVTRLLIDNGGTPGGAVGADLAQVMALHSGPPSLPVFPSLLSFQQEVAGYSGTADTCLASDFPTTNFASVPLEFVDSDLYRCLLMRFDNLVGNGPGQIPPAAKIREARLHLATGASAAASNNSHAVHRLLQGFNATTITYQNGYGGNGVEANGIEALATPAGTIQPMAANARQEVLITSAVQAWANGAPNLGLAILPGGADGLGLQLSEAAIATLRPAISVVLEPQLAYAEAVVAFAPTPGPDPKFLTPNAALGAPDFNPNSPGVGTCNDMQGTTVTLGSGGTITLRFLSASIAGSGNFDPDLWIYERGPDVEATFVEVSPDGQNWTSLGKVQGAVSSIDLDAFGFGPLDSFNFIRLTDDPNNGDTTGCSPGADIDAVAALAPSPWIQLGGALAGTNGLATLKASGALKPSSSVQIQVSNALPSSSAILALGYSILNFPLLGGTLVPFPDYTQFGLPLTPTGTYSLPLTWPNAVPAGIQIVLQFWFVDPAAPFGFAATNGIFSVTQ